MNERMVDVAVRSLAKVDVALWLVEATEQPGPGDRYVKEVLRQAKKPVVLGINKIDRMTRAAVLPAIESYRRMLDFADVVPFSALTGLNVDTLRGVLLRHLPVGEPLYPDDFLTDQPERFFVSEMVREQVLRMTRDEIPYTTGVVIDSFKEDGELVRIQASILVERDSQKAILIGKGGSMIKAVGTEARKSIEEFLGTKVFLGLFIKVRENWREDQAVLEEMGLGKSRED
jgi:GTP-binding protein Era